MPANKFILSLLFSDRPRRLPAILRGPYSQHELSAVIGVDQGTINEWEQGRAFPHPKHVRFLINHAKDWTTTLGVRLVDILDPDLYENEETQK